MVSPVRRLRAWTAIVAFAVTFGIGLSAATHFALDDDAACGPGGLATWHSTVQFGTAKTPPVPTHCPLCHWQRLVGGASIAVTTTATVQLQPLELLIARPDVVGGSTAIDERPSRAPPA